MQHVPRLGLADLPQNLPTLAAHRAITTNDRPIALDPSPTLRNLGPPQRPVDRTLAPLELREVSRHPDDRHLEPTVRARQSTPVRIEPQHRVPTKQPRCRDGEPQIDRPLAHAVDQRVDQHRRTHVRTAKLRVEHDHLDVADRQLLALGQQVERVQLRNLGWHRARIPHPNPSRAEHSLGRAEVVDRGRGVVVDRAVDPLLGLVELGVIEVALFTDVNPVTKPIHCLALDGSPRDVRQVCAAVARDRRARSRGSSASWHSSLQSDLPARSRGRAAGEARTRPVDSVVFLVSA